LNINHKVHKEGTKNTEQLSELGFMGLEDFGIEFIIFAHLCPFVDNKYPTINVYSFIHRFTQINTDDLVVFVLICAHLWTNLQLIS
jgi:hypothetical protein